MRLTAQERELIKDSQTPCQPIHQQALQYGAIL
jgi:hypothetical protein